MIPCLPSESYLYAYCMCITENLAVVAFYDLQELFPSVPLVSMSGILMPKTVCLGAYSILVLFFFLKKES